MTYEQFAATMKHESGAHGTDLLPYAEVSTHPQGYRVFCLITDADVEMGLSVDSNIYYTYDAAERALYDAAVKHNLL